MKYSFIFINIINNLLEPKNYKETKEKKISPNVLFLDFGSNNSNEIYY